MGRAGGKPFGRYAVIFWGILPLLISRFGIFHNLTWLTSEQTSMGRMFRRAAAIPLAEIELSAMDKSQRPTDFLVLHELNYRGVSELLVSRLW